MLTTVTKPGISCLLSRYFSNVPISKRLLELKEYTLRSPSTYCSTSFKGLNLTDSCVQQIKKVSEGKEHLRVQVDSGGCAGFQYRFMLDNSINEDDKVFAREGAKVVVDGDSLRLIDGASIDYHRDLMRCSFQVVNNPQAENGCSCGASFNVKI